jgi:hypothetical protein
MTTTTIGRASAGPSYHQLPPKSLRESGHTQKKENKSSAVSISNKLTILFLLMLFCSVFSSFLLSLGVHTTWSNSHGLDIDIDWTIFPVQRQRALVQTGRRWSYQSFDSRRFQSTNVGGIHAHQQTHTTRNAVL